MIRPELLKAIEEMINNPKMDDILEGIGSDYDQQGVPYWKKWEKDETNS